MNQQLKTILLTILTLSVFVIALVELSGVSKNSLSQVFGKKALSVSAPEQDTRMKQLQTMHKTTMQIDTTFDFGKIKEGDVVRHKFHFQNTGSFPLLIANVVASCGCTTPDWPKEPILPGADGDITVEFNSSGKPGMQNKRVMIYSNSELEARPVSFTAEVQPK